MSSNLTRRHVISPAGTLDLTNLEGNPEAEDHPDSSRPNGGPSIQKYIYVILGGFVTAVLLKVAIAFAPTTRPWPMPKLRLRNPLNLLPSRKKANTPTNSDDHQQAELVHAAIRETPSPTPQPTHKPTDAPTVPRPLNPQWFQTDHEQYQSLIANDGNAELHPWLLAGMFCHRQSLFACGYDAYCPNGKGGEPYKGEPPRSSDREGQKQNQWAPIAGSTAAEGFGWIQVGTIPESEKGTEDNDYGKCWKWEEWTVGLEGKFEDVMGEEHRQWILCCGKEERLGMGR